MLTLLHHPASLQQVHPAGGSTELLSPFEMCVKAKHTLEGDILSPVILLHMCVSLFLVYFLIFSFSPSFFFFF